MDDFSLSDIMDEVNETKDVIVEESSTEDIIETVPTTNQPTGSLDLTKSDFSRLLVIFKLLENSCTDIDIKHGTLRQKSNNSQVIFDIDLKEILNNKNLCLSLVKDKVALLKTFEIESGNDDNKIVIQETDNNFNFIDEYSTMRFTKPIDEYLDNRFITNDDFSGLIKVSEENLLLKIKIDNHVKRRIREMCFGFKVDDVICTFSDNKAQIKLEQSSKENSSTLTSDIDLNQIFDEPKQARIIAEAFKLDVVSDVTFSCYKTNSASNILCKFELMHFQIPIIIYTKAKLEKIKV